MTILKLMPVHENHMFLVLLLTDYDLDWDYNRLHKVTLCRKEERSSRPFRTASRSRPLAKGLFLGETEPDVLLLSPRNPARVTQTGGPDFGGSMEAQWENPVWTNFWSTVWVSVWQARWPSARKPRDADTPSSKYDLSSDHQVPRPW